MIYTNHSHVCNVYITDIYMIYIIYTYNYIMVSANL